MRHPWVVARHDDALEILDAMEAAALRRQKMPPEVVKELLGDPRPYGEIAEEYGVGYQMVAQIKARRVYAHVPFEGDIPRGTRARVDDKTAREIFLDPSPPREIAARRGVSLNVVRQIKHRISHAKATRKLTAPSVDALRALEERHKAEREVLLVKLQGSAS